MRVAQVLCGSLLLLFGLVGAGCASVDEPTKVAEASKRDCTRTTGSNVCRAGTSPTQTISGESLRRSGGDVLPPTPGRIGD